MGLSCVRVIAETLIARKCLPTTPIVVISRGTYLIQDCRIETLEDISTRIDGMKPPAIMGEVVRARHESFSQRCWIKEMRCKIEINGSAL